MKHHVRCVVATMITALFFSSFNQRVLAMDSTTETQPIEVAFESAQTDKPIEETLIQEIEDKREANVKHFLTDQFRYVAMVYPLSVHYSEDGTWKEIDNTLIDHFDEERNDIVEPKANGVKIRLAKNSQSSKLVSMKSAGLELSWTFKNIAKKAIQVIQPSQHKDDDLSTVEKLTSSVTYLDVFEGVDLEYVLRGDEVKENFILKSNTSQRHFTQVFRFNGLTPKIQDDGTIWLVDANDIMVFRFERFIMVDANGEESQAIQTQLNRVNQTWELSIQPDQSWLDAPERVYPVVVDPTVTTPISVAALDDAHVTASLPTSNFYNSYILKTGYGGAIHRTYLKFTLPHLNASDMVIHANLAMSLDPVGNSQSDYQVNVHKVLGSWSETGLTWNNKPAYHSIIEDYEIVGKSASPQAYQWNITSMVKEWYSSGVNHGLMLKDHVETSGYKEYYSADTSQAYLSYRPVVSITYVNNNGLEPYWTYHSQSVGRAGTGYTNDYNGNLVFIRQDTVSVGNMMSVSVSHVYNLNDRSSNLGFGNGWRLNYSQQAGTEVIGSTTYYYWIDEDGTKHYFAYDSAKQKYMDEAGTQLWMVKHADSSYTLNDTQNNLTKFSSAGKLSEIQRNDGKKITLTYNASGQLWKITDASGRVTTLLYGTSNCGTGNACLSSITGVDGKVTQFNYTGLALTSITEIFDANPAHNKVSTYTYDGTGVDQYKLLTARNFDGYTMTYSYSTLKPYRVIKFIESQGSTLGEELNLSYGYNTTFFTDTNNNKVSTTFNHQGNTISIQDYDGYAQYYRYHESGSVKNSLAVESKLQKTIINHLANHSFEKDASWSSGYEGSSVGTAGYSTSMKYLGNRSYTISKTNTANAHYVTQTITGMSKGKTYTFSGYVKSVGISQGTNVGAALGVYVQNASGAWIETRSKTITGTQDWQRLEVSVTIPLNSASTSIMVRPMMVGATGTVYFDALQLEEGSIANRYNLVENGSLASTGSWSFTGGTDANDKIVTLTSDLPPTSLNANVVRLNGVHNLNKQAYQFIQVSGQAGDSFVVSGWAKGASVPLSGDRHFSIYFRFDNVDGTLSYQHNEFNTDSSAWQFLSANVVAPKAFTRVCIILYYKNNVNTAYFDGISLFKEEFGQSYTYDTHGNVISISDLAKQNSTFQYTNHDLTLATDAKGNQFSYSYDSAHRIIGASSAQQVKYAFTYDGNGNATSATIGDGANGTKKIKTTTTYSADGNYVATKTDALGNTITTHIDSQSGRLNSVSDPLGRTISYGYHSDDALATVFSTVGGQSVSNSYTYENDRLKSITHNGFSYSFNYDALGQVSQVKVGTIPLITYAYQARTGRLNSSLYGNGDSVEYVYDALDRVVGVKHNGVLKTTYEYDGNGVIGRVSDVISGKSTRYIYDFANRLVKVEESNGNSVAFGYDANNNASTFIDTVNETTYTTSYTYDKDNRPTLVTSPKANTTGYVYDVLGRLTFKKWNVGAMEYSTTFTYKDHPTDTSLTSTQVASIQNGSSPSISYVYDANGNITSITEGTNTIQYVYNELNEVVRENNQRDNKSFVYHYDLGGNLLSKVEYAYTTATLGTPISTISYAYTNANWKDQLTSFNGKAITYDAIGNPLTYDGTTYSWQGRQLVSSSKAELNINYIYNDAGIRTSKSVNGVTTSYRLVGDRVTFEQTGSDTIYYVYDIQDQLISMILNNVEYAYVRNVQNDIVGLINSAGIQVVSYTYSTWGEVLSITGSLASSVGEKNPYRYRGYRYDSETGLYYLQSRYYNPQWGRFVNADDGIDIGAGLIGTNVFAYCANNPVNYYDPTGEFVITTTTLIIAGIIIGATAGGVAGGYYSYKKFGKIKWQYVTGGIVIGGVIGGLVGWGAGAILSQFGVIAASSSITAGGGAGFQTFEALKKFLGSPGLGKEWHHIVEQCQQAKSGFSTFWVQNSNNVINITKQVHQKISAHYSSIQSYTNGLRVRDWLAGQSFQKQYEYGVEILRQFGVIR